MSAHTGQNAGNSSQEHHGATADGFSRQHNGNAYYYYGSDLHIASLTQQLRETKFPTGSATENGLKLWRAARLGQLPRVQRLLKLGADIGYRCDENGTTALHQAVDNSYKDVVEALLEAGASVDDEDDENATALHFASRKDVAEMLIAAGADVDHEDCVGRTPGRRARDRQHMSVVEALITAHADPSKIHHMIGDGDDGRPVTPGSQTIEQPMLQQSCASEDAPAKTTAVPAMSLTFDVALKADLSDCNRERKLIIGIALEDGEAEIAYALANRYMSFGCQIKGLKRLTGPRGPILRLKLADHGIEMDFRYFGILFDPDVPPVHMRSKAELMRRQLQQSNKLPEDVISLFIRALHDYVREEFAAEDAHHSLDNLQTEVVVTVPPTWSEKLRIAVTQAARNNDLRDVSLIRACEAAVLYKLHSFNNNFNKQLAVGDTLLVCDLQEGKVSCTGENVISLKPFQLKQLGEKEVALKRSWNPPHRKITIPFYHTNTPAQEQQQYHDRFQETWREDIISIHLIGKIDSVARGQYNPLLADIEKQYPGIRVLHPQAPTPGEASMKVLKGSQAVMYGLLKNVE